MAPVINVSIVVQPQPDMDVLSVPTKNTTDSDEEINMETGINEVDNMVEGGKAVATDVKVKWKMKLVGIIIAGIGVLFVKFTADPTMAKIAIGVIVIGVLMILGTGGIVFILKQALSAGSNQPRTKL